MFYVFALCQVSFKHVEGAIHQSTYRRQRRRTVVFIKNKIMRDCTHVSVCLVAPPFHVPQPLTAAVADPVPVSAYGVFVSLHANDDSARHFGNHNTSQSATDRRPSSALYPLLPVGHMTPHRRHHHHHRDNNETDDERRTAR